MSLSPTVSAALIGGGVAVVGLLIRDIATPSITAWLAHDRTRKAAAERYAQPLARAAESLLFRLSEILISHRSSFLAPRGRRSISGRYKFESTIYRTAILLGWIWALKKEDSILSDSNKRSAVSIHASLVEIERALADGFDVEIWRLKRLCELWSLPVPRDLSRVAYEIEKMLEDYAVDEETGRLNVQSIYLMGMKGSMPFQMAKVISEESGVQYSSELVAEKFEDAKRILSVQQAWVYRDWQSAIGELMARRLEGGSARMFDMIGYLEFETLLRSDDRWLRELTRLYDGLEPDDKNEVEFRLHQLRALHEAIAQLLLRLHGMRTSQRSVSDAGFEAARRALSYYSSSSNKAYAP